MGRASDEFEWKGRWGWSSCGEFAALSEVGQGAGWRAVRSGKLHFLAGQAIWVVTQ
jgi:hypothetical protein